MRRMSPEEAEEDCRKLIKGEPDLKRCIATIENDFPMFTWRQCTRPRGHGEGGIYCKQHARQQERLTAPLPSIFDSLDDIPSRSYKMVPQSLWDRIKALPHAVRTSEKYMSSPAWVVANDLEAILKEAGE